MSLHATVALNRFRLGAGPGGLAAVAADPRHGLLAQLTPESSLPARGHGVCHGDGSMGDHVGWRPGY